MRYWTMLALPLFALLSCKSTNPSSASATLGNYSPSFCSMDDAIARTTWNGEKAYEVTERCVFNDAIHTVRMRVLSETYNKVLNDGCSAIDSGYGHILALDIDGHHIENVGFKVRGNTSRCNEKRQFKFSFTATEVFSQMQGKVSELKFPDNKGRRFFGLESISVRASANDPSMVREKVASDGYAHENYVQPTTLRGPGAYRLSFAKLYVSFNRNETEGPEGNFNRLLGGFYYDYKGFYSLAENLDKVFLETRFQKGNVPLNGYHLISADVALGKLEREKYDPKGWSAEFIDGAKVKTNAQKARVEEVLFQLMDRLKPGATDAEIEQLINVDALVNYAASSIFNGHWDSLLANANNDALYFDGATQKWQVLAWDLDNTLGANYNVYKRLMNDEIFQPGIETPNKMMAIVFAPERPVFRKKLVDQMKKLGSTYYAGGKFQATMDQMSETVKNNAQSWERYNPSNYSDIANFVNARHQTFIKKGL